MGFKTPRPLAFRRQDEREENFLVIMHYLADTLWAMDRGLQALTALQALLPAGELAPSLREVAAKLRAYGQRLADSGDEEIR